MKEETGDHGHLVADGVGNQLVHVPVCKQGEYSHVNGRGHTTYQTVQNKIPVPLILFAAKLTKFSHFSVFDSMRRSTLRLY